ncbi:hypothetical protein IFT48_04785 [Pseudomonas fluorescens]|uniref:hypothetical protein n=1 Tax=Pseudomonas TaxID=286 RepID=UPI000F018EA0|nr:MULTISPECIES: hypothetical protein [Pseudomonas]MBD8089290.1 hypothetical protein [Pseudomonas fluorescens]MBD8615283.1 hypothetical protein [Pseudomonas putida]MBD8682063.1 hypothetical protein [Pseudomonas sp. CFBP 13719]
MTYSKKDLDDPQNKKAYVQHGEWCEGEFLKGMGARSILKVRRNPEKDKNKYAIDFLIDGWGPCDLKTQNKPFFTARYAYGIKPDRAISFNVKDLIHYIPHLERGVDVGILFWVEWKTLVHEKYGAVNYRWGVYFIRFSEIKAIFEERLCKIHKYQKRVENNPTVFSLEHHMTIEGNAEDSIGLSLDWMTPLLHSHDDPWFGDKPLYSILT